METSVRNNSNHTIPDDEEQSTYRFIIVAAKRARHNKTVGRLIPKVFAIALLASPSAASRTTWQRIATLWGALCARVQVSNRRRSSASITSFSAGSHIGHSVAS